MTELEDTYNDFIRRAQSSVQSPQAKKLLEDIWKNNTASHSLWDLNTIDFKSVFCIPDWIQSAVILLSTLFLLKLFSGFLKSSAIGSAIRHTTLLLTCLTVLLPVYNQLQSAQTYMNDVSIFLGTLIPTIGTLAAAGGNLSSAQTIHTFLPIFLSAVQIFINKILPTVTSLFLGFAAMDVFSGEKKMHTISKFVRNTLFSALSVLTAIFMIFLCFQNMASTNTDTISARSLRLLVSNAIPIVGGSIGEALKLVGGGIVTVKNAVGTTAVIFLLALYLPVLLTSWINKVLLYILEIFCEHLEFDEIVGLLTHLKCAIEFSLAGFTLIFAIGILNIGLFMNTLPVLMT